MSMYNVTADSFTISTELNLRAIAAIQRTWQAIGSDVIDLFEEYPGDEEIMEMILDANRMEEYGNDLEASSYCIYLMHYQPQEYAALVGGLSF